MVYFFIKIKAFCDLLLDDSNIKKYTPEGNEAIEKLLPLRSEKPAY